MEKKTSFKTLSVTLMNNFHSPNKARRERNNTSKMLTENHYQPKMVIVYHRGWKESHPNNKGKTKTFSDKQYTSLSNFERTFQYSMPKRREYFQKRKLYNE